MQLRLVISSNQVCLLNSMCLVVFFIKPLVTFQEVNLAYENVKEVDCLDISREGLEAWDAAVSRYQERIDRVETRITAHLRDQLGTAKNANEMFRIFSRFNALFVRPHIRGAIREYQTQLIQRVKDDIEALHEKFKVWHCFLEMHSPIYIDRHSDLIRIVFLGAISTKQSVSHESGTRPASCLWFHHLGQAN